VVELAQLDGGPGVLLLVEVLDRVAAAGGGEVQRWVDAGDEAAAASCAALGLRPERDLWQMRRRLPVPERFEVATRPFRPGRDDEAWLAVNNAAFAWHPEQGGWTHEDLHARTEEPWFDPEGFLLHEADGELVGFCWTKVHDRSRPPLGEIFVIGVHPGAHGPRYRVDQVWDGLYRSWPSPRPSPPCPRPCGPS
jgi:mycothiol synthase